MAEVTSWSNFGALQNKVSHCFPSVCHEVMGPDTMILVFWMLSFKPTFSLSSFSFIKRLFSYSSLSAIRVVSSAYLRWLIFLLAILIPAVFHPTQHVSWCTLNIVKIASWQYSALTYSFPDLKTVCCSMSSSNFASWPAHRFPRRQVRWSVRVSGPKFGLVTRIGSIVFLISDQSPLKYQYKCSWSAEAQNPSGKHSPI